MSTRSIDAKSNAKGRGFSVVFRLGKSKGAARISMYSSSQKSKLSSFARTLIEKQLAKSVLGDRVALSHDPILSGLYVVNAGDFAHTQEYLERLRSQGEVELAYVAPPRDVLANRFTQASSLCSHDDSWRDQINLTAAKALSRWTPTKRVTVAVVDSGIDSAHPQLAHIKFVDHLKSPPKRSDAIGHGSHIAGLIAAAPCAENDFQGIATDCVDVTAHRGLAKPNDVGAYYRALRAAAAARIVNLSVGGESEDPVESDLLRDCLDGGTIVVVAMGNAREMGNPTIYPAALDGMIAVGAVDAKGDVADFSSYGDHILLAAPGIKIRSTVPIYRVPSVDAEGSPPLAIMSGT
jgi:subtilisin family serine protease